MPIIVFIPSPYLALSFYATPNPLPNRPALRTFQFAIPPCSSAHPFRGEAFHCPISNSAPSNAIQHLNLRVPHPSWFSAKDGLLPSDSSAPLLFSANLGVLCVSALSFSSLSFVPSVFFPLRTLCYRPSCLSPTSTCPPLPAPPAVPLHPPSAHPPYSQTSFAVSASTPAQSLPVSPKTPASSPKTPPPPPHPPHSARRAMPRPSSALP